MEALISFLPTPADGAIGALDWTSEERKRLAQKSVNYVCPTCGCKAIELLPKLKPKSETSEDSDKPKSRFQKEIEKLQQLQQIQHGEKEEEGDENEKKEGETTKSEKEPMLNDESNEEQSKADESSTKKEELDQPAAAATTTVTPTAQKETTVTEEPKAAVPPPAAEAEDRDANPQETRATQPPLREEINVPAAEAPMQQEVPVHQQVQFDEAHGALSWMVDPVLHGIIVVLAVLCFLLLRKLQTMKEELDALNDVLEG